MSDLRDMALGTPPRLHSGFGMSWDRANLYVAFDFEDPHREARMTIPGSHVYQTDTTAEIFIAGPAGYYELGVNSIGTAYQVGWTWVQPLVDAHDVEGLDRLFRLPNFLYYIPQRGERIGRVGDLDFRLAGVRHHERWVDKAKGPGWTAQIVLPWSSLSTVTGLSEEPEPGLRLRTQAMRVNPGPGTSSGQRATEYWALSVQGNHNVHNVERWAWVTLAA